MSNYSLTLKEVGKTFGRRLIFKRVTYERTSAGVLGLSGPNGSGKSTLAKIIAGVLAPTKGKVIHSIGSNEIMPEKLHNHIGFAAPYLILYDEFTAEENIRLTAAIRGIPYDGELVYSLFERFSLYKRRKDLVKTYSSGMKQRLKLIFSLFHHPELLILDEPVSNLDTEGKEKVYATVEEEANRRIIIIASNEESDLALCDTVLEIEQYKRKREN